MYCKIKQSQFIYPHFLLQYPRFCSAQARGHRTSQPSSLLFGLVKILGPLDRVFKKPSFNMIGLARQVANQIKLKYILHSIKVCEWTICTTYFFKAPLYFLGPSGQTMQDPHPGISSFFVFSCFFIWHHMCGKYA